MGMVGGSTPLNSTVPTVLPLTLDTKELAWALLGVGVPTRVGPVTPVCPRPPAGCAWGGRGTPQPPGREWGEWVPPGCEGHTQGWVPWVRSAVLRGAGPGHPPGHRGLKGSAISVQMPYCCHSPELAGGYSCKRCPEAKCQALGCRACPWQRPPQANHPMAGDFRPEGWWVAGRTWLFGVTEAPSWGASQHPSPCCCSAFSCVSKPAGPLPSPGLILSRFPVPEASGRLWGCSPQILTADVPLLPHGPLCLPVAGKARARSAGEKSSFSWEGTWQVSGVSRGGMGQQQCSALNSL